MGLLHAVVLGIVQGVTEFLPISSTAHLRIVPELLGWPDAGAAYTAMIQLGTVAAVIVYFWRDLVRLSEAWVQGLWRGAPFATLDARLAWFVLVGTLPVAILGLLFKQHIETSLRSLYVIALAMVGLALVLLLAERIAQHKRTVSEMGWRDAIIIGLCQAVALIPGASRSGTTLTGGLALGFRREDAARYSFLLSIPATTAAGLFEMRHLVRSGEPFTGSEVLVGTGVAFVTGLLAIAWLLRFLRTRSTLVFILYRFLLGGLLLLLLATGRLRPQPTEAPGPQAQRAPAWPGQAGE
ncbi:MAG: undecaprenyl-diphosphate phosphatase [Myxococcaceae bacterium]